EPSPLADGAGHCGRASAASQSLLQLDPPTPPPCKAWRAARYTGPLQWATVSDCLRSKRPDVRNANTGMCRDDSARPSARYGRTQSGRLPNGDQMKRSTDRILTTHVGSLARPTELLDTLRERENDRPYDADLLDRQIRDAVADRVRQQVENGIDIVAD